MRRRNLVVIPALLGLIGAVGYFQLAPYLRYGLSAAHIDEMDPFRIRHGALLDLAPGDIYFGAQKDQIPALVRPAFVPAAEAADWLHDGERVIGVTHNGVAKAYPTMILLWHEAVNDEVGGKPYLVTY